MTDPGSDNRPPVPPPPPPPMRPVAPPPPAPPRPPAMAVPPPGPPAAPPFARPAPAAVAPPPDRRRLVVGIAVGLLLALVAVTVAALVARGGGDTVTAPAATGEPATPATTGAPAPTTVTPPTTRAGAGTGPTGAPTTTGAPTEFDRTVDTIIAFVERARGLKFVTRPTVIALSDADFVARFQQLNDQDYRENRAAYDEATVVLGALGVLRPGRSYYDTSRAFGDAGVLGFYDPETKELSVRGNQITPFVRTVIAHELVHALDDQRFDLDRPEYDDADDEIGFGFSALAEGNARHVEKAYRASMSAADRASADREEASFGGSFDTSLFTTTFLQLQLAPYTLGEAFVEALLDLGGQAALDAAFGAPPSTSEQVIDVDKYVAKEARVVVPAPPADGAVVDQGVVGQIAIRYLLESVVGSATAVRAASGWAGDWYVAWSTVTASCIRMAVQVDTATDTTELKAAFDRWAATRPQGAVRVADRTVTATSCSAR